MSKQLYSVKRSLFKKVRNCCLWLLYNHFTIDVKPSLLATPPVSLGCFLKMLCCLFVISPIENNKEKNICLFCLSSLTSSQHLSRREEGIVGELPKRYSERQFVNPLNGLLLLFLLNSICVIIYKFKYCK